jgi:hypothetical protein
LIGFIGAARGIRTPDPIITNDVLYRLSYCGISKGWTPLTFSLGPRWVTLPRSFSDGAGGFLIRTGSRIQGTKKASHMVSEVCEPLGCWLDDQHQHFDHTTSIRRHGRESREKKSDKIALQLNIYLDSDVNRRYKYGMMMDDEKSKEARAVYEKWGEAGKAGFQAVPDLLLKNQSELGLNATELVVLLNVLMHWWYRDQKPFPRPTTIAKRMGSTVRTVQRAIVKMVKEGILIREVDQEGRSVLNPEPLVEQLCRMALSDKDYLVRTGAFFGVA